MLVHLNDSNFAEEVLNSERPCLVDFWAPWCTPCLMVAPVIEEVANDYQEKLKVCKLNVDDAPSVATRYRIMSIPTIMVFKNGDVVSKTIGALPKEKIEEMIKPHI